MWSLMSLEQKKGAFQPLFAPLAPAADKQFNYIKCPVAYESFSTSVSAPSQVCNDKKKKKKKKRRRRRRHRAVPAARQRQISVAESEDSFIICFDEDTVTEDFDSTDSLPSKKVRFPEDKKLCEVHFMVKWSYAYQAARKGPWEQLALDRDRFRNRINQVEAAIGHVFCKEHRSKIYQERFAED